MVNRTREYALDYPTPPVIDQPEDHVRALVQGEVILDTNSPLRVLEKGHPPTYYIAPSGTAMQYLEPSPKRTTCEFKGEASYFHLVIGEHRVANVAWYYPEPKPGYEALAGYIAFYASALDEATVNGEAVDAQAGRFYGGWINSWVEGPFKGGPTKLNL